MNHQISNNFSSVLTLMKVFGLLMIVSYHFMGDWSQYLEELSIEKSLLEKSLLEKLVFLGSKVGAQGIYIFFFASGFGLALSDLKKENSFFQFSKKRISRLLPSYFKALIVTLLLYFVIFGLVTELEIVLKHIFLLQTFSFADVSAINTNWWFVATVMQMYIAYYIFRKYILTVNPYILIAICWVLSFIYRLIYIYVSTENGLPIGGVTPFTCFFLNYFWIFICGVAFARLPQFHEITLTKRSGLVLVLGFALFEGVGAYISKYEWGKVFNDDLYFIGIFSITTFVSILTLKYLMEVPFINRSVEFLNKYSYEIYLIHHPISRSIREFSTYSGIIFLAGLFLVFIILTSFVGRILAYPLKLKKAGAQK